MTDKNRRITLYQPDRDDPLVIDDVDDWMSKRHLFDVEDNLTVFLDDDYEFRLHREDGPAYIFEDDLTITKLWLINSRKHRPDGPAMIKYHDGKITNWAWFIHGMNISDAVEKWQIEYGVPPFTDWTNVEKVMFKLRFG